MQDLNETLRRLADAARHPTDYAQGWKHRHAGRPVIGILPMNFPAELVHAAGALPVLVQEDSEPITAGRTLLYEFYCGYTRSLADQAATGRLDVYDAVFLVDHCVALLGAVDAMRFELPAKPMFLAQYTASMDEAWTPPEVRTRIESLRQRLEEMSGARISDEALDRSISLFNRNRQLLRRVYDLRREGRTSLTASDMQILVKSSMVMDIEDHTDLLVDVVKTLEHGARAAVDRTKIHLSGHLCHAPKPELLAVIEDCGAIVVDDDLYTGYRYISTDVPVDTDRIGALTRWYFDRNRKVPCATRAQKDVDWETYLLESVRTSGAEGVIVLMAKFCEPHMLYFPEVRKALDKYQVPHLLIETEHEGLALEPIRTRVEAFIERIRRGSPRASAFPSDTTGVPHGHR